MSQHSVVLRRAPLACTLAVLVVFELLAPAAQAQAQDRGRVSVLGHRFSVIAGASLTIPRSAETRSLFGDRTFAPVLSIWNFESRHGLGLSWDVAAWRMRQAGREAKGFQGGVGPRFMFADNRAAVAPFVTVRGDAYVLRLDGAAWHTKPGVNVEVGASLVRHFVISARYDAVPKVGGVELSTFSASAAVKIF
jgi:hypothetical protein